jgi:ParB/RepB/Spo0J family partition protein
VSKRSVIVDAPVAGIESNPYQVRDLEDDLVAELEVVIREHGFRGVLVGRAMRNGEVMAALGDGSYLQSDVGEGFVKVQLAWGHHRLEAARRVGLKFVPVEVVAGLTDEEMASHALMENVRRRDMTAIDEAKAIRQMVDGFGWSQKKVAEALGYGNAATVSNKLRLLSLPQAVQDQVRAGNLAERTARMLVPLAKVSAKRAAQLVDGVKDGEGAPNQPRIRSELRSVTKPLWGGWEESPWPKDHVFGTLGEDAVTCGECEEHVRVGETEVRCTKVSCWHKRRREWEAGELERASAEQGIPVLDKEAGEKAVKFGWEHRALEQQCTGRGGPCEWLRLVYDNRQHPHVQKVCGNPAEFEKCIQLEKSEKQKRKDAEEKRAEHCREELRKDAVMLAGELESLSDEMVLLLRSVLGVGSMWTEIPEDMCDRDRVGWRLIVRASDFKSWEVPTLAECKREIELVLEMAGLGGPDGKAEGSVDRGGAGVPEDGAGDGGGEGGGSAGREHAGGEEG